MSNESMDADVKVAMAIGKLFEYVSLVQIPQGGAGVSFLVDAYSGDNLSFKLL